MQRGAFILVLVMGATAAACGCKSKGSTTGTGTNGTNDAGVSGPQVDPKVCDEARAHVETLYTNEMPDLTGAEPEKVELERQIVTDNVDMMLIDCRKNPRRFAPCLKSAVSVAQMERDCLLPLDDEGREGNQFLNK